MEEQQRLTVFVSAEERDEIKGFCKSNGLVMSHWARTLMLREIRKAKETDE